MRPRKHESNDRDCVLFSEKFSRTISASPSMRRDSGAELCPDCILLSTNVGRTALPHAHVSHTNNAISTFLLFDEYRISLVIFRI